MNAAQRALLFAFGITAFVAALEFWGGARARSLSLTGDAVHVCMDLFAFALALAASFGAARPADPRRTFGYGRIEVLGALVNGTLLLVATVAIAYFAVRRFVVPVD
ncbi:MAG: cation transporter, partial [Candidatus Eremiobacteraeota bacterium]|nr:cation transporter [Candidatus Eremiobacteraeota bacterium]